LFMSRFDGSASAVVSSGTTMGRERQREHFPVIS
jgi:hypothetical protein